MKKTIKWLVNLIITLITIPIYIVGVVILLLIIGLELLKFDGWLGDTIKESYKNIKKII